MVPWTGCCWSSDSPSVCTNSSLSHPPARPCLGPGNQGNQGKQLHGCPWELAFCWGKCPWDKAGIKLALYGTSVVFSSDFPSKCAPVHAGGWGEGGFLSVISSGLFLALLQTLRVWNVGLGYGHTCLIPFQHSQLMQDRPGSSCCHPELLHWAGIPGAKGKAWNSLGRSWECR